MGTLQQLGCAGVALCWAGALVGCAHNPTPAMGPEPAGGMPAQWQAGESSGDGAGGEQAQISVWWTQLGDPALADLVTEALAGSPTLGQATERVAAAQAQLAAVGAARRPELAVEATAGRGFAAAATGERAWRTDWTLTGRVSWALDVSGARRARVQAAAADAAAAEEERLAAAQGLIAAVVRARLRLDTARRLQALAQDQARLAAAVLVVAMARHDAGLLSASGVRQARENEAAAVARLPDAALERVAAGHALAVLLGRAPQQGAVLDEQLAPMADELVLERVAAGVPAALLDRRPDLRAARYRLEAAAGRRVASRRDFYPDLTLSASLGTQARRAEDLLDAQALAGQLLGQLLAPVDVSGARQAALDAAGAREREAALALAGAFLVAMQEAEDALAAEWWEEEALAAQRRRVAEAAGAASMLEAEFEQGLSTLGQVLESQRRLAAAAEGLVLARAARLEARVALAEALGGQWWPDVQAPEPR